MENVEASRSEISVSYHPLKALVLDWPHWWAALSPTARVAPFAFVLIFWFVFYAFKGLRIDHFLIGVSVLVFGYFGRLGRRFLEFMMPVLLTAILYDSMRFYADSIRGSVHVTEPYFFDKRFFGISTPSGILTPNEWFQLHLHPVLDLITGFAYLIFIGAFLLTAAYFSLGLGRKGSPKCDAGKATRLARAMMWSFFWCNALGYSTYYWYAAAPPWYVARYGLGPAQMDAPASSAGCARFDEILGTHFFSEMYGRAADVFGAIPSLHVAYPLIAVYFAFRLGAARAATVSFFLLMCFSAVYLNHHYILDIIWGSAYAILVAWVVERYYLVDAEKVPIASSSSSGTPAVRNWPS